MQNIQVNILHVREASMISCNVPYVLLTCKYDNDGIIFSEFYTSCFVFTCGEISYDSATTVATCPGIKMYPKKKDSATTTSSDAF